MLENIIETIVNILIIIIDVLPSVTEYGIPVPEIIAWFGSILYMVNYIVPVDDILKMIILLVVLDHFHITWKALTRIWDALPFT